jgi:hypothetical protein
MSEQEPPSKGYVVRDRRRFDADGSPRESEAPVADVVRLQPAPRVAEPRPALRNEPPRAAPARPEPVRAAPEPVRAAPEPPRGPSPASLPPAGAPAGTPSGGSSRARRPAEAVDFSQLVLSLATNAMVSLEGSGPDGRMPGGRPNLAAAEQNISILIMLEEKTRGNLTAEEAELLTSVLYDLRMQYVAIAQALQGG